MKPAPFIFLGCFLLFAAVSVAAPAAKAHTLGVLCRNCHGNPSLHASDGRSLFVDASRMASGLHGRAGLDCVDCHVDLRKPGSLPHPAKLKKADCVSCHRTRARNPERGICRFERVGAPGSAPTCAGCHGGHDIRRLNVRIPARAVARAVLRAVRIFYVTLIAAFVAFSLAFVLADLLGPRTPLSKKLPVSPLISEDERFDRMGLAERLQHGVVLLAFLLLALTGLPLLCPGWKIFGGLSEDGSGFHVRGILHRAAAVFLIAAGVAHAAYVGFTKRGRRALRDLRPGAQDVRDAVQAFGHNLGFARFLFRRRIGRTFFLRHRFWLFEDPPLVDVYGFVEKFEYWSLVWGTLVMTVSGLFLWRTDLGLFLFPPWFFSLFTLVHGYEATLAILAVLVWHMYHAHLRAGVFPMSGAWLNGSISGRELRLRHPLRYLRIRQEREARRDVLRSGPPREPASRRRPPISAGDS
jgi:cytochrome b subunit of formate dehydrogenase